MGLRDTLGNKSLTAYTTSMDKKYEALSDRQVAGLCYMLPMKLANLKKNDHGLSEIEETLIDCMGVIRQSALRFPELLDDQLFSAPIAPFTFGEDVFVERAKDLKEGQIWKLSDLKDNMSMAKTMIAMSEVKSGARKLGGREAIFHQIRRGPLPDTERHKFFDDNFERIALPLEGMSCTEAVDQILADPKGYEQKEEAQPPRKRQNQYERFINGGVRGKELTACQTEAEKSASRGSARTQG